MKIKEFLVLLIISLHNAMSTRNLDVPTGTNSFDAIKIISEIISSIDSTLTVNLIDVSSNSSKYSSDYDFTLELYKTIQSKQAVNDITGHLVQKVVEKRYILVLIKISSIADFQDIIKKFTYKNFDYSGFYIIFFEAAEAKDVQEMFKKLWELYISNVNLIRLSNNSYKVETFVPFSPNGCNVTDPIQVATFKNGTFLTRPSDFFPEKFKNFYNCSFNVTTFETIGPAVLRTNFANGTYKLHGRDVDILNTISEKLNFHPIIYYNSTYGGWGLMNADGSGYGGFYNTKLRGSDITFGNVNLKIERTVYLGFTFPYAVDLLIFIIPPGRELSSMQKLLRPFDNVVWVSLSLVFSFGFVIIAFFEIKCRKEVKNFIFGYNVSAPFMNFLIAIFGGSQQQLPKGNFARFILMVFLLFCLVMRALYQGSLFEFLQSSDKEKEPQTIAEMAAKDYGFFLIASYNDFSKGNVYMEGRRYLISPEVIKKLMVDILNPNFKGTIMLKMSQVLYSNRERSRLNQQPYKVCKVRI